MKHLCDFFQDTIMTSDLFWSSRITILTGYLYDMQFTLQNCWVLLTVSFSYLAVFRFALFSFQGFFFFVCLSSSGFLTKNKLHPIYTNTQLDRSFSLQSDLSCVSSCLQSKWCRLLTSWASSPPARTQPQRCAASNRWLCWFRGTGLWRGERKQPQSRLI